MKFWVSLSVGACLASLCGGSAGAAQIDPSLLMGAWKLTSVYDEFADGRRRETWGAHPMGMVEFGANGVFSGQFMAGDRTPKPGTVPSDPVGPALAYYGTYEVVDAKAGSFVTHVTQATWPQWNGATLPRTVIELTATTLKVVSAPIKDPSGGEFQPHLEFERIK
jgi:hypothetical protein